MLLFHEFCAITTSLLKFDTTWYCYFFTTQCWNHICTRAAKFLSILKSKWKAVVSWFNGLDLHLRFARNKTILNNISCGCPTGASLKYSLKRRAFGYWRRHKPQFNSTQCQNWGKLDFCLLWQNFHFHWHGMDQRDKNLKHAAFHDSDNQLLPFLNDDSLKPWWNLLVLIYRYLKRKISNYFIYPLWSEDLRHAVIHLFSSFCGACNMYCGDISYKNLAIKFIS